MVKCLLVVNNKIIVSVVGLGEWEEKKKKKKKKEDTNTKLSEWQKKKEKKKKAKTRRQNTKINHII